MVESKDVSTQDCEDKLSKNPESFIFSRLADCYRKRGDIQQAIEVCSRGIADHPDSITGRVILGRCFLEQEKYKEASIEFIKVIEQDRRNQVALKMLADIYAHQGMKEKAGDLYGFLLTIDPENQSIVNLAAASNGSGVTSIYRILGFSEPEQVKISQSPFQDAEEAFAQTIQMNPEDLKKEAARQESAFARTMQFDAEELNPEAQQQESGIEEVVGDLPGSGDDSVTGDDISLRMSMMFKEEIPDAQIASGSEVSGSDISQRIEQLFGESAPQASPTTMQPSAGDYTQLFDSSPSVAEQPAFPGPGLTSEVEQEAAGNYEEPSSDVSGEDIVSRMSEMFEKSGIEIGPLGNLPEAEETLAHVPENVGQRESVSEVGETLEDVPENAVSRADILESPTGSGEPEMTDMLQEGAISGDDIARRLETIFEEEEPASSIPSLLSPNEGEANLEVKGEPEPSISDMSSFEEKTLTPDTASASEATVIQDISNDDFVPFIEQKPAVAITSEAAEPGVGAIDAAPELVSADLQEPLDDAMPVEEAPGMSGDDVRTRLDEIFPDGLISEETLSIVEEIPEGEKEDEKPNQGFYTMSGEDAVVAASDEKLLKQLDDVEIEVPAVGKDLEAFSVEPPELVDERALSAVPEEAESQDDSPLEPGRPDADRLNAIPDHVLTPTLADIYFQQGQPQLAVQIYSRLLQKDPENEKLAKRLEKIKTFIAETPQPTSTPAPEVPQQPVVRKPAKKSSPPKSTRKASSSIPKPLAGVRIKKKRK